MNSKTLILTGLLLLCSCATSTSKKGNLCMNTQNINPEMKVLTPSEMKSTQGPEENFTGVVNVVPLVQGEEPSCLSCASVNFTPGARSAWHTHPKGQILVVTEGSGLIQEWGKPIRIIKKGDVIWTPPGIKHWHGASKNTTLTHTAIQESLNGKVVEWMEKVTDEEYAKQ